jgi:hypothetical protein
MPSTNYILAELFPMNDKEKENERVRWFFEVLKKKKRPKRL